MGTQTGPDLTKLRLPDFVRDGKTVSHIGVSGGGCLSLLRCSWLDMMTGFGCIDLWVMKEYGVPDSWTKLFNLKLEYSELGKRLWHGRPFLVMENSTVAVIDVLATERPYVRPGLIRIDHNGGEEVNGLYEIAGSWFDMVVYEESLLWIGEETQN